MQIFNLVVLSVIIAARNVSTPHISKTYLLIVLLNVRELKLNRYSKDWSSEKASPRAWGCKSNSSSPPQSLKMYLIELPLFIEVCVFRMLFNLNKILPVMHELKWAQISSNEPKWSQKSLNEFKWV